MCKNARFKKIIALIISTVFILASVSCGVNSNDDFFNQSHYTIKLDYDDGSSNATIVSVQNSSLLKEPKNPNRPNYIFDGWYVNKDYKNTYDFSKKVVSDFTLYAKWSIDYVTLTNTITTSTMKSNVTVKNKSYNTFLLIETSSIISTGSGIIFHLSDKNNYFVLTNNHVTVLKKGYTYQKFTVTDYLGNEYTATRLHQSAEYDLAVVYFQKKSDLKIVEIDDKNIEINTDIVALGQPKGQSNAITYGKVLDYKKIGLNNTESYASNVAFDIMAHNAPIASGSSGGAILNLNLKIAGINYAGSTNSNNEFLQGYAIPASKINEYLDKYIFKSK